MRVRTRTVVLIILHDETRQYTVPDARTRVNSVLRVDSNNTNVICEALSIESGRNRAWMSRDRVNRFYTREHSVSLRTFIIGASTPSSCESRL